MSASAWGSVSTPTRRVREAGEEKMTLENYELGVLLRGVRIADYGRSLTFRRPARRYDPERDVPLHFQDPEVEGWRQY